MSLRKKVQEQYLARAHNMEETLVDLIAGCLVYSLVFEGIGLIFVPERLEYTLGLILGTAVAIGLSISMYRGIDECVDMDPVKARRTMTLRSIIRAIVMLGAAFIGMKFAIFNFPAVIIGIMGLKISAYLHMYTNVYITGKLRKKGR